MKLFKLASCLAFAFVLCVPAGAAVIPLTATMDGPQANAGSGTGSAGTGLATIDYDTDTNVMSWNITWSGLSGTPTAMHFHGAALPNQNAGVQVAVAFGAQPVVGNAILNASQEIDLLAGLWYLNLHSTTWGGGEIRGTVRPNSVANEPQSLGSVRALFN